MHAHAWDHTLLHERLAGTLFPLARMLPALTPYISLCRKRVQQGRAEGAADAIRTLRGGSRVDQISDAPSQVCCIAGIHHLLRSWLQKMSRDRFCGTQPSIHALPPASVLHYRTSMYVCMITQPYPQGR